MPPAPNTEQLILACIHAVCHGPYTSAMARHRILYPVAEPVGHFGMMMQAEVVLTATFRALIAELPPQALDRIGEAVAAARVKWPPQFRELDGGNHFRPV